MSTYYHFCDQCGKECSVIFDTIENVSSIDDLIKISKVKGANITILLETAFIRGLESLRSGVYQVLENRFSNHNQTIL